MSPRYILKEVLSDSRLEGNVEIVKSLIAVIESLMLRRSLDWQGYRTIKTVFVIELIFDFRLIQGVEYKSYSKAIGYWRQLSNERHDASHQGSCRLIDEEFTTFSKSFIQDLEYLRLLQSNLTCLGFTAEVELTASPPWRNDIKDTSCFNSLMKESRRLSQQSEWEYLW